MVLNRKVCVILTSFPTIFHKLARFTVITAIPLIAVTTVLSFITKRHATTTLSSTTQNAGEDTQMVTLFRSTEITCVCAHIRVKLILSAKIATVTMLTDAPLIAAYTELAAAVAILVPTGRHA